MLNGTNISAILLDASSGMPVAMFTRDEFGVCQMLACVRDAVSMLFSLNYVMPWMA